MGAVAVWSSSTDQVRMFQTPSCGSSASRYLAYRHENNVAKVCPEPYEPNNEFSTAYVLYGLAAAPTVVSSFCRDVEEQTADFFAFDLMFSNIDKAPFVYLQLAVAAADAQSANKHLPLVLLSAFDEDQKAMVVEPLEQSLSREALVRDLHMENVGGSPPNATNLRNGKPCNIYRVSGFRPNQRQFVVELRAYHPAMVAVPRNRTLLNDLANNRFARYELTMVPGSHRTTNAANLAAGWCVNDDAYGVDLYSTPVGQSSVAVNNLQFSEFLTNSVTECGFGDGAAISADGSTVVVGSRGHGMMWLRRDNVTGWFHPLMSDFLPIHDLSTHDTQDTHNLVRVDISPSGLHALYSRAFITDIGGGVERVRVETKIEVLSELSSSPSLAATFTVDTLGDKLPKSWLTRYGFKSLFFNAKIALQIIDTNFICHSLGFDAPPLTKSILTDDLFFTADAQPEQTTWAGHPTVDVSIWDSVPKVAQFDTVDSNNCISPVIIVPKPVQPLDATGVAVFYWRPLSETASMSLAQLFGGSMDNGGCGAKLLAEAMGNPVRNEDMLASLTNASAPRVPVAWFAITGVGHTVRLSTHFGVTSNTLIAVFEQDENGDPGPLCASSAPVPGRCVMASADDYRGFGGGNVKGAAQGMDGASAVSFCSELQKKYLVVVAGTDQFQTGALILEAKFTSAGCVPVLVESEAPGDSGASTVTADVIAGNFEVTLGSQDEANMRNIAWNDYAGDENCRGSTVGEDKLLACALLFALPTIDRYCDEPGAPACFTPAASGRSSMHIHNSGRGQFLITSSFRSQIVVPFDRSTLVFYYRARWLLSGSDQAFAVYLFAPVAAVTNYGFNLDDLADLIYTTSNGNVYFKPTYVYKEDFRWWAWSHGWVKVEQDLSRLAGLKLWFVVEGVDYGNSPDHVSKLQYFSLYRSGQAGVYDEADFFIDHIHFTDASSAVQEEAPRKTFLEFPEPLVAEWAVPTVVIVLFCSSLFLSSVFYVRSTLASGNADNDWRRVTHVLLGLWTLASAVISGYFLTNVISFQETSDALLSNLQEFRAEKFRFLNNVTADQCFRNEFVAVESGTSVTGDLQEFGDGGVALPPGLWPSIVSLDRGQTGQSSAPFIFDWSQQGTTLPSDCLEPNDIASGSSRINWENGVDPASFVDSWVFLRFSPAPSLDRFRWMLTGSIVVDLLSFVVFFIMLVFGVLQARRRGQQAAPSAGKTSTPSSSSSSNMAPCLIDSAFFLLSLGTFVSLIVLAQLDPVQFNPRGFLEPLLGEVEASLPIVPSDSFGQVVTVDLADGSEAIPLNSSALSFKWCDPLGSMEDQTNRNVAALTGLVSGLPNAAVPPGDLLEAFTSNRTQSQYFRNQFGVIYMLLASRSLPAFLSNAFLACSFPDITVHEFDQCISFKCGGEVPVVNGTQLSDFAEFARSFVAGGVVLDAAMVMMDLFAMVVAYVVLTGAFVRCCCASRQKDRTIGTTMVDRSIDLGDLGNVGPSPRTSPRKRRSRSSSRSAGSGESGRSRSHSRSRSRKTSVVLHAGPMDAEQMLGTALNAPSNEQPQQVQYQQQIQQQAHQQQQDHQQHQVQHQPEQQQHQQQSEHQQVQQQQPEQQQLEHQQQSEHQQAQQQQLELQQQQQPEQLEQQQFEQEQKLQQQQQQQPSEHQQV